MSNKNWQELKNENNDLKNQIIQQSEEIKKLRQENTQHEQLEAKLFKILENHNIDPNEIAEGIGS